MFPKKYRIIAAPLKIVKLKFTINLVSSYQTNQRLSLAFFSIPFSILPADELNQEYSIISYIYIKILLFLWILASSMFKLQ